MAIAPRQFQRIAHLVAERLADLLSTPVTVADERKQAIAPARLQVPLEFEGHCAHLVIGESNQGEPVSPRLVQKLVEMVLNQLVSVTQLPHAHELKNKFIHDLLRGAIADESDILRQGQLLGMDFSRPRAVILIHCADYILEAGPSRLELAEARIQRQAQHIIDSVVSFFHLPSDTICGYIGDGEVAVLKASSTQDLVLWVDQDEKLRPSNPAWADLTALKRAGSALLHRLQDSTKSTISLGIGRHHAGIRGLAQSYQDARAALSLGQRFYGPNQVHCLDQLGIAAFVGIADEATKIELAGHLLSPLDQEADLLLTLEAFFAQNCCPSATASRLSIHRNTLSYRLDKITSLTGLDPRRFDEAMQIRLALMLRSLTYEQPRLGKRPIPERWTQKTARQTSDESWLRSTVELKG